MATSAATVNRREPGARRHLWSASREVALAALAGVAAAVLLERVVVHEDAFVWRAAALVVAGGAVLAWLAARKLAAATFGAANRVTLVRGVLTLLCAALIGAPPRAAIGWTIVALATLAALLDAVDGRLARRRGAASAFGARFDMETDALLILILALLAWQLGKAGVWIVLAGALRYLFVAAGRALPWLESALPPSRRRQAACVIQIVSLIVCAAPSFVPPVSGAVALAGLVLLAGSFALDVAWLARHARA